MPMALGGLENPNQFGGSKIPGFEQMLFGVSLVRCLSLFNHFVLGLEKLPGDVSVPKTKLGKLI